MKASPDLNDTLRTEGEAAVRNRLDNARRYQGNGPDAACKHAAAAHARGMA